MAVFPLRVCRFVRHTCQCIHLCQRSFMSNGVLWGTCDSACGRGLNSLAFSVVCSCTHASMHGANVGKPVQSAVFYCPHAHGSLFFFFLWRHTTFEHSFLDCSPLPFPVFSTVYTISVWRVPFFPSAWGLMAGLPGFASHGSSLI